MEVPPATVEPAAPPSPAPQSEPLVPTYVQETLDGLKELFGRIIGHLEKMADKLNNIELKVERLEHTMAL